jgi:dUTP pyrophosphatase
MTLVYLAEPIDRRDDSFNVVNIGDPLARKLATDPNTTVYRPRTAWAGGQHNPTQVEQTNRAVLAHADLIIADLCTHVPTIGVPAEIEYATRTVGIAALVVTPGAHWHSVVLDANPRVTLIPLPSSPTPQGVTRLAGVITQMALQIVADDRRPSRSNTLRYILNAPDAAHPTRAYPDDAGIDLTTARTVIIEPKQFVDVPTTVAGVQTPPDAWLLITGRSSTLRKRRLHVPVAVIDPGWRGPLYVGAWNLGDEPVTVEVGDRIGQAILLDNRTARTALTAVSELDPHPRGTNGFGSSG